MLFLLLLVMFAVITRVCVCVRTSVRSDSLQVYCFNYFQSKSLSASSNDDLTFELPAEEKSRTLAIGAFKCNNNCFQRPHKVENKKTLSYVLDMPGMQLLS